MHNKNKSSRANNSHDIIIIGAGIGGIICGCYLARGGLKVLLLEKNINPGGYCCYFRRGSFKFDVGVHYLGSMRPGGYLSTIFRDLSLDKNIKFERFRISDVIYSVDTTVQISSDFKETVSNFKRSFPEELSDKIESFFNFINESSLFRIISLSQNIKSFDALLDLYFKHKKIKNFLKALLGNTGSIDNVHLIPAVILFKEFILDGGYYPYRGFGELSFALINKFKELGGEYLFNNEVAELLVNKNSCAEGVITKDGKIFKAKKIISDGDISLTFTRLLHNKKDLIDLDLFSKECSKSVFVVYLGLNSLPSGIEDLGRFGGLWFIPKIFSKSNRKNFTDNDLDVTKNKSLDGPFFITIPTLLDNTLAPLRNHIMRIQIVASFKNEQYWNENKKLIADLLIRRVEDSFGSLRDKIVKKHIATPFDFYRYTYNKEGAMVGWAPTIHNYNVRNIKIKLLNFYQVGHWSNLVGVQGGVSMAALTGKLVAQKILQ